MAKIKFNAYVTSNSYSKEVSNTYPVMTQIRAGLRGRRDPRRVISAEEGRLCPVPAYSLEAPALLSKRFLRS